MHFNVLSFSPWVINTKSSLEPGMDKESWDKWLSTYTAKVPMGRMGETEDIATAVLFMDSNGSSFVTGSNLVSDGGDIAANLNFDFEYD